jgi:glycosyltransferase involved in cell wall biosynthesis
MTDDPVLTIVIPSYNYARYLGDCLNSIFGQVNAPPFEVVLVDDGSTDETPQLLEMYADPRLRVIRRERNLGHIATINEALPLARGKFVARIDPDDRYRPHFMAHVCRVLDAHPDVGFVYARAALIDDRGRETGPITAAPHEGDFKGSEFVRLLERNFICAPASAGRREAWLEHVPVPDGLAFNDWYFSLLIARRYPFYFLDDVIADYRVHGANHHARISKDGSEERSIFWLLDRVFALPDDGRVFEAGRQEVLRRVYGAHYLDLAEKYFGFGRNADARRCYLAAIRYRPAYLSDPGVARRFGATVLGRRMYDRTKALLGYGQ